MPSPRLTRLLLIATLPICASVNNASAQQVQATPEAKSTIQTPSAPDETRIASDLNHHTLFAGESSLGVLSNSDRRADVTSIRTSVRTGELLEFRVTSLYFAKAEGALQREVETVVRYRREGNHWTLLSLQNLATRDVVPNRIEGGKAPC